jgi:hypothetical protein
MASQDISFSMGGAAVQGIKTSFNLSLLLNTSPQTEIGTIT